MNIKEEQCLRKLKPWEKQEKQLFADLYKQFKINFDSYLPYFPGRTRAQIKSFYYNQIYIIKNNSKQTQGKLELSSCNSSVQLTNSSYHSDCSETQQPTEIYTNNILINQLMSVFQQFK
ncbi:SANT/Myb_domain [Hexamita inflata]|uniref:SANT/Myb domain n=1 Tax=Hexamita inflata TaxID=28002 RepID=A0AA86RLH9_9EUKA|nr:SANT/Myb domain [Hexamita inflata]